MIIYTKFDKKTDENCRIEVESVKLTGDEVSCELKSEQKCVSTL